MPVTAETSEFITALRHVKTNILVVWDEFGFHGPSIVICGTSAIRGVVVVFTHPKHRQEDREILYIAIDQHRKQLTVNLRNEQGDVFVKRQVSTEWLRGRSFLEEVWEMSVPEGGFVAILEVCGFNDWLVKLLAEHGCRETILVQPEKPSKKKTGRRDANALGELLWGNRRRLLARRASLLPAWW